MTDYSEQDTERARELERSSAGLPTQHLPAASEISTATPSAIVGKPPVRPANLPALALIVVGAMLLLGQAFPGQVNVLPGIILMTIGSCLLFFSFWQRMYPLLIPGCILLGLSIGIPFAGLTSGVSIMWGLALGFLAVLLVGRSLFGVRVPWPVFPAVSLFGVGVIMAAANLPTFLAGTVVWLPLLLIGVGLYLGWGRR